MSRKTKSNYHGGERENTCYFCGSGPPLEEHHVIPRRFDGPDSRENIVELCQLCHQRLERLYDKSFFEWFGISDETGGRSFHRPCEHGDCSKTADLKFKNIRKSSLGWWNELLCFRHAVQYYRSKELRYILRSETVNYYNISELGWRKIEKRRKEQLKEEHGSAFDESGDISKNVADSWVETIKEDYPLDGNNLNDIDRDQLSFSKSDLKAIGLDHFEPVHPDGEPMSRFEIMEEHVIECSSRVEDYFTEP